MHAIQRQSRAHRESLARVVRQSAAEFAGDDLAKTLQEALRAERARPAGSSGARLSFRRRRDARIRRLLASAARPGASPQELQRALHGALEAYLREIAGRFDPLVYRAVIASGRFGFNWLSHVASGSGAWPFGLENLLPTRIRVTGEVAQVQRLVGRGTVLLVPTHQSHNDILLFGHLIDRLGLPPFAWGAGLNLFENPWLAFVLRRAGAYTVDRDKRSPIYRSALHHYSAQAIASGVHSLFFPGGGRSRSGAIEPELRLGLLRSGLQAQRELLRTGPGSSRVYVVPVTVSYHHVLEAPWLIDEHLASVGIGPAERRPGPTLRDAWRFHWRSFAREDGATVRFGTALDMLGQCVDQGGRSLGADGSPIDPNTQRDRLEAACGDESAVVQLAALAVESFHRNATVLPSQLVAFALFESVRAQQKPGISLAELLGLPSNAWSVARSELREASAALLQQLRAMRSRGEVALSPPLESSGPEEWLADGLGRLAEFHGRTLIALQGERVVSRDPRLLYYYRNRLSGLGLSRRSTREAEASKRGVDREGFLA